jgi:hypothetical protein
MWQTKLTHLEKEAGRELAEQKRKFLAPTLDEIKNNIRGYCRSRHLSEVATNRIVAIANGRDVSRDYRDQRTLRPKDRVPRSLEFRSVTPPRYWEIFI